MPTSVELLEHIFVLRVELVAFIVAKGTEASTDSIHKAIEATKRTIRGTRKATAVSTEHILLFYQVNSSEILIHTSRKYQKQ